MTQRERFYLLLTILALAVGIGFSFAQQPSYGDAFYYAVGARTLAEGGGFNQPFLWNYIGDPSSIVVPSHTYWMPIPSMLGAIGMRLAGMTYLAAQIPFVILLVGMGMLSAWLAYTLTGSRRVVWLTVIVVMFGGFYGHFWGMTSSFTPYAVFGSACLVSLGLGLRKPRWYWFSLAGGLVAFAHLTRADGVLLLGCGVSALAWMGLSRHISLRQMMGYGGALVASYLLCMLPWLLFNWARLGTPLPIGGTVGIWITEIDDLARYPRDVEWHDLFSDGGQTFLQTRLEAFTNNLLIFFGIEGAIILTPFMLIGASKRYNDRLLIPFFIYALYLHGFMTFVFAVPGFNGSLIHSSSALWMFWVVLGWEGLDHTIAWVAKRRQTWNQTQAQNFFSIGLATLIVGMSIFVAILRRPLNPSSELYPYLQQALPPDAVVMIYDPSQLYYYTRLSGVVLPHEQPHVIQVIAQRYGVDYLVLESVVDGVSLAAPSGLMNIPTDPPSFLTPIPVPFATVRMYRIETP